MPPYSLYPMLPIPPYSPTMSVNGFVRSNGFGYVLSFVIGLQKSNNKHYFLYTIIPKHYYKNYTSVISFHTVTKN